MKVPPLDELCQDTASKPDPEGEGYAVGRHRTEGVQAPSSAESQACARSRGPDYGGEFVKTARQTP